MTPLPSPIADAESIADALLEAAKHGMKPLSEGRHSTAVEQVVMVIPSLLIAASDLLRAQCWRPIDAAAKSGADVLLRYERTDDLPEPWPLVIIAHWSRDGSGYWVWQTRASRGYSTQPIAYMPLPSTEPEVTK